jgi:hypothetical protein
MKIVLIILACLLFSNDASAQIVPETQNSEVGIEEITLSRDDGNGKIGEATDKFLTTDIPIHCSVHLNSTKAATIKLILVAVKAEGLKPGSKSVSISYTTNGKQNQVNFNASPDSVWAAGSYRADVFINGRLAKTQTFKIEKSPKEIKPQNPAPKSFIPRKSTKKARKINRAAN